MYRSTQLYFDFYTVLTVTTIPTTLDGFRSALGRYHRAPTVHKAFGDSHTVVGGGASF